MTKLDVACREARDSTTDDPVARERIALHVTRCESCRDHAAEIERIKDAVLEVEGTGLDDITKARIRSKMAIELDRQATLNAAEGTSASFGRVGLAAAALVAAAAVIAVVAVTPDRPAPHPELKAAPVHTLASVPSPAIERERAPAVIVPTEVAHFEQDLGRGVSSVDVPDEGLLRARASEHVRLSFLSSTRASVIEATTSHLHLRLETGTLLVDVDPGAGQHVEIETHDAQISVIGTLFSVEANESTPTAVSVVRGAVEMKPMPAGRGTVIKAGQKQRLGSRDVEPIDPEDREALLLHAAAFGERLEPEPPPQREAPTSPRKRIQRRPVAKVDTAESMYEDAEVALADGDHERGLDLLEALVRRFPREPQADTALYELARISYDRSDLAKAKGYLEELVARDPDPALEASARYMLCRVLVDQGDRREAVECLRRFSRAFVSSPRAAEASFTAARLVEELDGCDKARPLYEEHARTHQGDPTSEEATRRCAP